ncbi:MAG: oligosaccharide flippase family protein [Candidatus Andersenbacteria bacterium]
MKQSRLTGAVFLMGAQAFVLGLGYITHLIIGRLLGPGPYGVYGVVLSIQSILGIFLALGVPSAVSRFVAQDEQHAKSILRQALRLQAYIAVGLSLSTVLLAPVIARILNDTNLTPIIYFVALVIFSQAFYQVHAQFLSGMHFFNRQAALTSLYAVAKLVGALALIFVFGVYGAFAGFIVGGTIAAAVGWYWTKKVGGDRHKKLPMKSFLSFAGIYVLILVGLQLLMSLDLFMVKALLQDDVQAGYYNAAVTLSRISYFILQGLTYIILPSVSALTKPGMSHDKAAAFIRDVLRYLIALIVPSVALAAATSKNLIILFLSREYLPAAPLLTVLMVGLGGLAFYLLLTTIVAGAGKAKIGLYITVGLIVLSAILGTILIPRFGLIGGAWQTTITSLVGLLVLGVYSFRTFSIPVPVKSVINIIIATGIAVAPTYVWSAPSLLLPVQYVVLLLLYIIALWVLGEISVKDRTYLASLHPKLKWVIKK